MKKQKLPPALEQFTPPPEALALAKKRTAPFIADYLRAALFDNGRLDLESMAASVYLQGVTDGAQATERYVSENRLHEPS